MSQSHEGVFPMVENEHNYETRVTELAPDGLGFGEGTISLRARIDYGELSNDAIQVGKDIIIQDQEIFVTVEVEDDGCGDGRPAARIFRLIDNSSDETKEYFSKSKHRAKVFGGGLTVGSSMWRAVEGVPRKGETVLGDRKFIAAKLDELGIKFGAHSDNRAAGEKSGCGAIDVYPQISRNILTYEANIRHLLPVLYGVDTEKNQSAVDDVFNLYQELHDDYFVNADGKTTMGLIEANGAIVKELADDHLEDFIVMNDVEGTTFDQRQFDFKLKEKGIEETAQVFAIDTWRGRMYAEAIASIYSKIHKDADIEYVKRVAYADFLIRTLAVSGTLTAGDLPTFGRTYATKPDFSIAT